MPAACRNSSSSPPRPKMKGSPPLRRTTFCPACAASSRRRLIASCPIPGCAFALADEHLLRVAARAVENVRADQFVVENHVRRLQRLQRAQGQQIRVARTGADKMHDPVAVRRGRRFEFTQQGLLPPCPCWPDEESRADRAVDHLFPEAADGNAALAQFTETLAIAAHPVREFADARRQDRFDLLAQAAAPAPARRRRSRSRPRHRRDRPRPGKMKVERSGRSTMLTGIFVRARERSDALIDLFSGRRNDGERAGEIVRIGLARDDLDLSRRNDAHARDRRRPRAPLREPAHIRAGRAQQAQLCDRGRARTDQHHASARQVEKDRQETHRQEISS